MNNHSLNYYNNGTAYIPIEESPFSNEELVKLNSFCNEVNKEFIQIGDAGELNHLLVGSFMTDIEEPKKVDNKFSDKVIEVLGNKKDMVYILWGKNAQLKKSLINTQENLVIESAHPSPFSADKGFFGSKPFSKTNDYLIDKGKGPINWKLV